MTMNPQPLHIDFDFAQKSEWGKPLVNSLFTLGLVIGISVHDTTLGTTVANLGMKETVFPHPLFHGDTLRVETVQSPIGPVNLLESNDQRHEIFLAGRQSNVLTGELVNDRPGNPLFFTPHIRDETAATEGEGVRIMKFLPDPNAQGPHNANDYPVFRLAEMHLIKAEALNELGQTNEAVNEVNTIRARVFDPPRPLTGPFTQESLRAALLKERLFELTAEGKRRQDLVRHGRYLQPWSFKQQREAHRVLMAIPQTQIDANPELRQNPGYAGFE
jgi:hypothetical protein